MHYALAKMYWATLWAIFSQAHLVTLNQAVLEIPKSVLKKILFCILTLELEVENHPRGQVQ
jgi:hypothetical protein